MMCACTRADVAPISSLRDAHATGALANPLLTEASGVVQSTRADNVYWSQNDSGNDPLLFAYDSTGASLGVVRVLGAQNRDWEAIAIGACPVGSCLYIGDVGDNGARRDDVTVYRIPEPLPTDTISAPAVALHVRYVDGPRDVESMIIAPDTSILLFTKRPMTDREGRERRSLVYRVLQNAWLADVTAQAALIDSLPMVPSRFDQRSWITDASLSPPNAIGARSLAVRTNNDVYIFATEPRSARPGVLQARCDLRALREPQGEGVTWLRDGRLLFVSEGRASTTHVGWCP